MKFRKTNNINGRRQNGQNGNNHSNGVSEENGNQNLQSESSNGTNQNEIFTTTEDQFTPNLSTGENTLIVPSFNSSVIPPSPQMTIQRNALNLAQFNSKFMPKQSNSNVGGTNFCPLDPSDLPGLLRPPTPSTSSTFKFASRKHRYTTTHYWMGCILNFIPFFKWIKEYNVGSDLIADILCGITVAIFQVPQSMGYCLIARVPPVHGLYTAFFPALIYTFLGTSKHSAVGAFAIVSGVMTGHLVTAVSEEIKTDLANEGKNVSDPLIFDEDSVHVAIASSAALWIAIYMLVFGLLRLGMISIYLSPQSISGFQTAASIYVFTSQLSHLTGVNISPHSGLFAIPYNWIEVVVRYKEIQHPTITISVVMITFLAFFKVFINEWLMKLQGKISGSGKKCDKENVQQQQQPQLQEQAQVQQTNGQSTVIISNNIQQQQQQRDESTDSPVKCTWNPLPFPIELIVVIVMTIASHQLLLEKNYNVHVVGPIKQGFPDPQIPKLEIFHRVWIRSIPLALVGYVITLSVGQFYGGKHGYVVDPNQELIALGSCNLIGSFFGCLPSAASLPRSAIQENTGGKTQIVSLVNCGAMLVVLYVVGSLLEKLPNCVLASIISVALIGLIGQVRNVYRLWRVSHGDSLQWLFSFLAVIILDVDNGLYAGTAFSLLVLVYQSSSPKSYILGSSVTASAPDVYVPIKMYPGLREATGIKIFQFCGPLHFSSRGSFRSSLLSQCNLKNILSLKKKTFNSEITSKFRQLPIATTSKSELITHLILDFSMVSYVDSSGIDALRSIQEEMAGCNIKVYIANCAPHVVSIVTRDSRFMEILRPECVFISVHDALLHALDEQKSRPTNRNNSICE